MYFLKERKLFVILNGEMVFYFFKYIIFFYNFEAMFFYFVKVISKFSKGLILSYVIMKGNLLFCIYIVV